MTIRTAARMFTYFFRSCRDTSTPAHHSSGLCLVNISSGTNQSEKPVWLTQCPNDIHRSTQPPSPYIAPGICLQWWRVCSSRNLP